MNGADKERKVERNFETELIASHLLLFFDLFFVLGTFSKEHVTLSLSLYGKREKP
jgi:hypothetical protein